VEKVKARIGYISPAAVRNPSDWNHILPPGVILVAVTLNVKAHTREEFEKALEKLEDAALTLKGEGAEVVVMSGTPLATLNGKRAESELLRIRII
jgi:hypothetical protein